MFGNTKKCQRHDVGYRALWGGSIVDLTQKGYVWLTSHLTGYNYTLGLKSGEIWRNAGYISSAYPVRSIS